MSPHTATALPASLPGRGLKPWDSLRSHARLALLVSGLVLLLGLPLAWVKGSPQYQAEVSMQVAPRYMRNLKEDQELEFQSNTQYRQFVEHQRQSITRHDILLAALQRAAAQHPGWRKPGESERRSVDRLRERLQVSAVSDTYFVRISIKGDKPEGLAEMLNAIAAVFIERMKQEEIFGADARSATLRQRAQTLEQDISSKVDERSHIARELSLTTFAEGTPNPYDQLIAGLRNRLSDARQRRRDADAALQAFRQRGDTTLAVRSVQEQVLNDPGLNGLKSSLSARRAVLLTQKSGLRGDHPAAQAADRELAEIEAEIATQGGRLQTSVRDNALARLQGSADQAAEVEHGLKQELADLEPQATRFARLFQDAQTLSADIAQMRSELDRVRERLNFLTMESSSFGFVRLAAPALPPELPFGPGRKKLALLALLAALGGGVAAAMLRDLLDTRVRTVNDAQRLMAMPPAGWQIAHQGIASEGFADEQLRRLAAALMRTRDTRGCGLFGLSGCKPGAGTTTLLLDIASTLRTLGAKVLVVEANGFARDSRLAAPGPGLAEWLQGQAEAETLVRPGDERQPARVHIGGQGRTALSRLDKLGEQLIRWAQHYDFVLVDMPPLLSSADAELLVRSVGQMLLVLDAESVTRGEVRRARRMLEVLDPDAIGFIVNRVATFSGGGYLREAMLESLTARRAERFFTLPAWRLQLHAWLLRFSRSSP
jgi:uncharacterized protein involved in exopolysaccharide biosynthesis/Mrp family chromosome partitioning ATPase